MKIWLRHWYDVLSSSYWFVPSLLVVAAMLLAMAMLRVDEQWGGRSRVPGWTYSGGADGARAMLAAIASSIITVAGVVFSITIVILTQASMQFGPRLLRSFMRDTGSQVVLGTFVATFIYSLLVLRRIYGAEDGGFVPHLSVNVAVLLAIVSIVVLIYYIHHVSTRLQAPHVVAAVGQDLTEAIEDLFPDGMGTGGPPPDSDDPRTCMPDDFDQRAQSVRSKYNGYIQAVDGATLMHLAVKADVLIRLDYRPGQYVIAGNALMDVWPAERCDDRLIHQLRSTFIIGNHRTSEQDVEFAIHQMVETGVRALSPGINDPFTAITCTDWLGATLSRLGRGPLPSGFRYDDEGHLRVVTKISTFAGIVDAAFNMIRQYGHTSAPVMIHLLEVVGEVARQACGNEQRQALRHHLEIVYRQSCDSIPMESDQAALKDRYEAALKHINSA